MRRTRRCAVGLLAIVVIAGAITAGCGSGHSGASVQATTTVTAPTEIGSGAFAVDPVPEGWAMYGAYAGERLSDQEADLRGVLYKSVPEDPDLEWEIVSRRLAPGGWEANDAQGAGVARIDVNGHEGYVVTSPRDDGSTETVVTWLERQDRVVTVVVPSATGLDAVALAAKVYELSEEAYAACHEQCHVAGG